MFVALLAFVVIGALATRAILGRREVILTVLPPEPAPLPPNALELTDAVGPSLADLDGDGVKDLVVRGWRPNHDGPAIYVAAFDGKTYDVRWRAGPFRAEPRGEGQIVATPSYAAILVGDDLHVLDGKTGGERRVFRLPERVTNDGLSHVVDLETGVVGEPLSREACAADGSRPCLHPLARSEASPVSAGRSFTLRDGADAITLVATPIPGGPGVTELGVFGKGRRTALVPATRRWTPWPSTAPPGWTALAHGHVHHVYPMPNGSHRIAIRSLATGALEKDAELPGLVYGTVIHSVTADQDRVFIVANGSLIVVDAVSAAILRRVDRF